MAREIARATAMTAGVRTAGPTCSDRVMTDSAAIGVPRAPPFAPARFFGLTDRGVIEPGRRADLVLIDGDPVHDIRATRSVSRVWCGGVEHVAA
jgi:cytosine/adenosine deaminase-related metal-dependent hydrolase